MKLNRIFTITVLIYLGSVSTALSQTLKVIDETTLQPVENVYIFNEEQNKTAVTDNRGEADISKFDASDYLIFQHPSFKRRALSYTEIQEDDFLVKLTERSVIMDELYVSASKREQDQTEIPQKITQINEEQIRFSNPQTSADLLQASGKVFVQKSQMGGGSPMIRGFAANSVMIAVDGVRMNNAIFRSGNLQNVISLDPNAIKNTEVTFGPGSIIYGSDALGGVMNFQTKDPELSFTADETFMKSNMLARYASANNEKTIHADANVGHEKWGSFTSITYTDYDHLRSGGNFYDEYPDFGRRSEYVVRESGTDQVVDNSDVTLQRPSAYEQFNLMQKIRFKPSQKWDINYGFHFATTTDLPRYDRLIERENGDTGQFVNSEWYYGPQIWMMNVLEADLFAESSFYDKVSGVFSHQWFQESRNDRKFQDTELRNREENVDVLTANIDFDKNWGEGKQLYYGVESIYNYVKSTAGARNIETGETFPVATRYPDGGSDYTQLAAYAKYRMDLSSNLTAVSGVRYSHVFLNSQFSSNGFYDFPFEEITINTGAVSGSLGFTWRPVNSLQFNLNGSTGFRAPNVDDAAKVFDSEPGTVIVPNDNIKPEYSYNVDFAMIKNFSDLARLEINTFYTWLEDAMVRRDFQFNGQDMIVYDGELSDVEAIVNAGKAYVYGASASLGIEISRHLAFDSNLTYTEGKDISNQEPLRHVAPVFGRAGFTYKAEKIRVEAYTEFNGEKDISDFSPSEQSKTHLYTEDGSPSWATLNIKSSYQINETLQVNAGVENILDKHYRPYSSGISAAGRNVILALRATL